MINRLLSKFGEFAEAIYRAFLSPGELLLSFLAYLAPDSIAVLTLGHGAIVVPFVLALLFWTALAVIGLMVLKACKNALWQFGAIVRTILFRSSLALGGLKMRLVWRFRSLLPRRKDAGITATPMIEFHDLDIAVLRSASAQGPGFAVSAPELAEKFTLRPAQVQRSLDKLSKNKMLCSVVGSTDGYDNYRLTDSGFEFVSMLERQQTRLVATNQPS